jgi:ketosteroid isomerase-like protein
MRHLIAATLTVVMALSACGGGSDESQAKDTVKQFFTALQKRDAAKLCDHLLSKDFIKETTLGTDDPKQECRRQFKQLKTPGFRLVRVGNVKVNGDNATVAAVIERDNQPQPQVFRLKREDGSWRLANPGA